jgi:DNA repair ATPase RecN
VGEELRMLKDHIVNRKEQQIFTSAILEITSQRVEDGLITEVEFTQVVDNFYNTFLEYIENEAKLLKTYTTLNNAPSWHKVQKYLQNTKSKLTPIY